MAGVKNGWSVLSGPVEGVERTDGVKVVKGKRGAWYVRDTPDGAEWWRISRPPFRERAFPTRNRACQLVDQRWPL